MNLPKFKQKILSGRQQGNFQKAKLDKCFTQSKASLRFYSSKVLKNIHFFQVMLKEHFAFFSEKTVNAFTSFITVLDYECCIQVFKDC